jgi:hypothetical protein
MFSIGVGDPGTLGFADLVIPGFDGFTVEKLQKELKAPFPFPLVRQPNQPKGKA